MLSPLRRQTNVRSITALGESRAAALFSSRMAQTIGLTSADVKCSEQPLLAPAKALVPRVTSTRHGTRSSSRRSSPASSRSECELQHDQVVNPEDHPASATGQAAIFHVSARPPLASDGRKPKALTASRVVGIRVTFARAIGRSGRRRTRQKSETCPAAGEDSFERAGSGEAPQHAAVAAPVEVTDSYEMHNLLLCRVSVLIKSEV